jgi:hypothetical protein
LPDPSLTPHELHQKAISVLDQLERIAADWAAGRVPSAVEIDVVTRAAVELRRHIEAARTGLPDAGPAALHHLVGAREQVAEAIRIVLRLADEHPGWVPAVPRGRVDPPGPEG